jgi:SAM-dependent methyltransferase
MPYETVEFDETGYLAANPDVAAAVRAGKFSSGAEHYACVGVHENRSTNPRERARPFKLPFPERSIPSRRDKILANLDLKALEGLEIGALASPLVSPTEGDIFYIDHADTTALQRKYADQPTVDVDKIVHVNAVWGLNTLPDCIPKDKRFDYVVASHVAEHVPDLITWLAEVRSVLRPTGTLRLAVPDRRFTFDYLRFESRLHDVVDAFLRRARAPLPRLIMEHFSLFREVDCAAAWSGTLDVANLRPSGSTQAALDAARNALLTGTYYDTHCWVFTPVTFAALFAELARLDLVGFACAHHVDTARNEFEFFVHMIPSDDRAAIVASWDAMRESLKISSAQP